jgi:hypothetical protein
MPTLNINGQRIKVDDSFMGLSPDQQSAEVDHISKSLPGAGKPSAQQGGLWNSAADFFKSIGTGGITHGLTMDPDVGLDYWQRGGAIKPQGDPTQVQQKLGLPAPEGAAGRYGSAIGSALAEPSS